MKLNGSSQHLYLKFYEDTSDEYLPYATLTKAIEYKSLPHSRVPWRDASCDRIGWNAKYVEAGACLRSLPNDIVSELYQDLGTCWIATSAHSFQPRQKDIGLSRFLIVARKVLQRGSPTYVDPYIERLLLNLANMPLEKRGYGLNGVQPTKGINSHELRTSLGWYTESELATDIALNSEEEYMLLNAFASFPGIIRRTFAQPPLDNLVIGLGGKGDMERQRRSDFLLSRLDTDISETLITVEVDGSQHTQQTIIDKQRDRLLKTVDIGTVRVTAAEVRANNYAIDELEDFYADPLAAPPIWHPLIHGPIQIQRLMHALLEGIEQGILTGDTWSITLTDPTGLSLAGFAQNMTLFKALDFLWNNGKTLPTNIDITIDDEVFSWEYDETTYSYISIPENYETEPNTTIMLDLGLGPLHKLPEITDNPTIVVRDAPIPIQTVEGILPALVRERITIPENPQGEKLLNACLHIILNSVFGIEKFNDGQIDAVIDILYQRDCIVLLPTGGGKSLIYQISGLIMPGSTIIVDPIIALMEDQERSLARLGMNRALAISSNSLQEGDKETLLRKVQTGDALYIFISPERLQNPAFRDSLGQLASETLINLAVADEAHCVSEWGHDFRTAYLKLGFNLSKYCADIEKNPPPILALTGTASQTVLKDVIQNLSEGKTRKPTIIKPISFDRKELTFEIVKTAPVSAANTLQSVMFDIPARFNEPQETFYSADHHPVYPGIIFVPHKNGGYGITDVSQLVSHATGVEVKIYSGGPPKNIGEAAWEKKKRQEAACFLSDKNTVLVTTKAFGMGIDKPNIRYIVHYGIPGSIESYYQEVGRAGRDREHSHCILIVSEHDQGRNTRLMNNTTSFEDLRAVNAKWANKDDIDRQLFFFSSSFIGETEENLFTAKVIDLIDLTGKGLTRTVPFYIEKEHEKFKNRIPVERALHRLSILGIVSDYTVDWATTTFTVYLNQATPDLIEESLTTFIARSQPGREKLAKQETRKIARPVINVFTKGCMRILIGFIYETIAQARRRSLREMLLASRTTPEELRQRILDYLQEGDVTGVLNKLAVSSHSNLAEWTGHLSDIVTDDDAREWRGSAARLLTAYPDQPGLLISRGYSELFLHKGDKGEGIRNIDAGFLAAEEKYQIPTKEIAQSITAIIHLLLDIDEPIYALTLALNNSRYLTKPAYENLITEIRTNNPTLEAFKVMDYHDNLKELAKTLSRILKKEQSNA